MKFFPEIYFSCRSDIQIQNYKNIKNILKFFFIKNFKKNKKKKIFYKKFIYSCFYFHRFPEDKQIENGGFFQ